MSTFTFGAGGGGGLFGGANKPAAGGFGTGNAAAVGGGMFGGGMFGGGNKPAVGGFGTGNAGSGAAAGGGGGGGLFGTGGGGASMSGFGGPGLAANTGLGGAGGMFNMQGRAGNPPVQQQPTDIVPADHWMNDVQDVVDAYNPQNVNCRFLAAVYDRKRISSGSVIWPEHMQDLMQQAQRENPDPKKFVACPILGIDGLEERVQKQNQAEETLKKRIAAVETKIGNLRDKLQNTQDSKLPSLEMGVQELQHRLLKLMMKLDNIRGVNTYLTKGEYECLRKISEYLRILHILPERLTKLQDRIENPTLLQKRTYETIDPDTQKTLESFLKNQEDTISKLQKLVDRNLRTTNIIRDGLSRMQ